MNTFELGQHTEEGKNVCRHCGARFFHTDETLDICRYCWGSGKADEERLKPVLDELRQVSANVSIMNTGGNCMVIMVPMADLPKGKTWFERYCYLTDAEDGLPEDDGMSEGQRWVVGYYEATDDDEECGETIGFEPETRADGLTYAKGVTLSEALDYLWARQALCEIEDDLKAGVLDDWKPSDGFTALHEVVDANVYLESAFESIAVEGDAQGSMGNGVMERAMGRANRVADLIEARLAAMEAKAE